MKDEELFPYYQFVTVLGDGIKISGDRRSGGHFISADSFEISEIDYKANDIEILNQLIEVKQIEKKTIEEKVDFISNGKKIFYELK